MTKISCIIPAYNVEQYIERCLNSISRQKGCEVEILVVDDGSTDATGEILRRSAAQDPRIRVFHQKNAGQGVARNFGLTQATGDYIWFIDADDWIEEGALLHVQRLIEAHAPDVVFTNFARFSDRKGYEGNVICGDFANEIICPEQLSDAEMMALLGWVMPPFRLIAHKKLLDANAVRFASNLFYEDHPFSLRLLRAAKRMYVDPLPIYTYYQRVGSTTRRQDDRIFDFISVRKQCLELLQLYGWDVRFPSLFQSYLLPVGFYTRHVPKQFQKKFLYRLQEELTASRLLHIDSILRRDAEKKLFLQAVKMQSPLLYDLNKFFLHHIRPQSLRKYLFSLLRCCKKNSKNALKKVYKILQGKACSDKNLYLCHPSADLERCSLDVRVTHKNAPYVYAEEGVTLAGHLVFERGIGRMRFGRRSSVGGNTTIICSQAEGIEIGEQVMVSWGCTLMDSNAHALDADARCNDEWYWQMSNKAGCRGLFKDWTGVKSAPIRIDDQAWIGCNSLILGGVHIGRGAIVGAGSVVTHDIPPFAVVAGNPARFVKPAPRRKERTPEALPKTQETDGSRPLAAVEKHKSDRGAGPLSCPVAEQAEE